MCGKQGADFGLLATRAPHATSHAVVIGTAAALGWNPVDDLVGVHDVAGLAVYAVGEVDLKLLYRLRPAFRRRSLHHLVNRGRAEVLAGVAELFATATVTNIQVRNHQVRRLVIFVPRAGVIDIRQAVKRQLAVALRVAQKVRAPVRRTGSARPPASCCRYPASFLKSGPRLLPREQLLNRHLGESVNQSVLKALVEIPHRVQLFADPALVNAQLVFA